MDLVAEREGRAPRVVSCRGLAVYAADILTIPTAPLPGFYAYNRTCVRRVTVCLRPLELCWNHCQHLTRKVKELTLKERQLSKIGAAMSDAWLLA